MDKISKNKKKKDSKVDKSKEFEYDYDFVPVLNEWVDIDEQKETVERLEDID